MRSCMQTCVQEEVKLHAYMADLCSGGTEAACVAACRLVFKRN